MTPRSVIPINVCYVSGCEEAALPGKKFCEKHQEAKPPVREDTFIRPPSKARLMAGR